MMYKKRKYKINKNIPKISNKQKKNEKNNNNKNLLIKKK